MVQSKTLGLICSVYRAVIETAVTHPTAKTSEYTQDHAVRKSTHGVIFSACLPLFLLTNQGRKKRPKSTKCTRAVPVFFQVQSRLLVDGPTSQACRFCFLFASVSVINIFSQLQRAFNFFHLLSRAAVGRVEPLDNWILCASISWLSLRERKQKACSHN